MTNYLIGHSKYEYDGETSEDLPLYAESNDEWGEYIAALMDAAWAAYSIGMTEVQNYLIKEVNEEIRLRLQDLYLGSPQGYDTTESLGLPSLEDARIANPPSSGATVGDLIDYAIEHYDEERDERRLAQIEYALTALSAEKTALLRKKDGTQTS